MYRIPKSHALVLCVIELIEEGEEITVSYVEEGYYGDKCLCVSCFG